MASDRHSQMGPESEVASSPSAGLEFTLPRSIGARRAVPTLVLGLAILLAAVIVVVAKPLTADAASAGTHHHGTNRSHVSNIHAQKVSKVAPGVTTSPNWSGYVAYAGNENDGSFNQVSANWVEPKVLCPKKNAWTLFWVGFDGWPSTNHTVEQGGTSAQCINGVPKYTAFYEMWPSIPVTPLFSISAGDQISASVVYSASTNLFTINVTDVTTGQSASQSPACPSGSSCLRSSAEWIAESPAHFGTQNWFPLANYGTVNFTSATAMNAQGESGPISFAPQWSETQVERVAGASKPVAKPSNLGPGGYAFTDTWQRR